MKHAVNICLGVTVSLFAFTASAEWESSVIPRGFQTQSSLPAALTAAQKSGQHVIVYYTRTNCPPCNVLRGQLSDPAIGEAYKQGFVFTVVWCSSMGSAEREDYRQRLMVRGAPTWIVYRNTGQYLCTAPGGFDGSTGAAALFTSISNKLREPAGTQVLPATRCL